MIRRIGSMFILGLCSAAALAATPGYQPNFHPDQLKGPPAGRPNFDRDGAMSQLTTTTRTLR